MMSQCAKSNKSDMWQIWLLHHVTHRICWLVWQVGFIYKKTTTSQHPLFLFSPQHIPELCRAHPLPKTERSAGDKSSNQLPLLPFNSKNGPMNWILSVLTHILRATIFMLPIQKLPSLNCRVNRTTGTDSPHYILTNCLDISQGGVWYLQQRLTKSLHCRFHCSFFPPLYLDTHSWADWAELAPEQESYKLRCWQWPSHPSS